MPVLDARIGRGQTAMHLAASTGNYVMVETLLEYGAGAPCPQLRKRCSQWLRAMVGLVKFH